VCIIGACFSYLTQLSSFAILRKYYPTLKRMFTSPLGEPPTAVLLLMMMMLVMVTLACGHGRRARGRRVGSCESVGLSWARR
jgi:hypothetical protein